MDRDEPEWPRGTQRPVDQRGEPLRVPAELAGRAREVDRALHGRDGEKAVRTLRGFAGSVAGDAGLAWLWAAAREDLGDVLWQVPAADPVRNTEEVIAAYQDALRVYSPQVCPVEYGMVRNNLGNALRERGQGDPGENVERAIEAYLAALAVRDRESDPYRWARTQNNLGNAYAERRLGDRAENEELAVAAYRAALEVHTIQAHPGDYAMDQTNLGLIYAEGAGGDPARLDQAMICFLSAILVFTPNQSQRRYRRLLNSLGDAFRARWELTPEDRRVALAIDLRLVIEELQRAQAWFGVPVGVEFPEITVEGERAAREADRRGPRRWLPVPSLMSGYFRDGYLFLPLPELIGRISATGDLPRRIEMLRAAVARDDVVLPSFRADLLDQLGADLLATQAGDLAGNVEEAIGVLRAALDAVGGPEDPAGQENPARWPVVQGHLANAFGKRFSGDRADNLERAIEHCGKAVEALSVKALSVGAAAAGGIRPVPGREEAWVTNVALLGQLYRDRLLGDQDENRRRAVGAFELTEAVWTRKQYPYEWARVQNSLGLVQLGGRSGSPELVNPQAARSAAEAFRRALKVISRKRHPDEWAGITRNLASALLWSADASAGDRAEAVRLLDSTLTVHTRERSPREWARVQHNLGQAYYRGAAAHQGTSAALDAGLAAAAEHFSAALEVHTLAGAPADHRATSGALGEVRARQGDWAGAHRAFASASAATEILLTAVSTGAHGFDEVARRGHDVGELDCFALCQLGRAEEAVAALERGRAAWFAESVGLRDADPDRISDPGRRDRYLAARDRLWAAQEAVNELRWSGPGAAPGPGGEALARTEELRAARAGLDAVLEEIEAHRDPAGFRAAGLTAAKITEGIGNPLVYLLATPWGGLAVAVLGTSAGPERASRLDAAPQLAVIPLPGLTGEFVDDLVQVTLPDGTGRVVGGFASAQEGIGLNWLANQWEGSSLADKAAALRAACADAGVDASLADSADRLLELTYPGVREALRRPVSELSAADLPRLKATVDHAMLDAELRRCLPALGAALEPLARWLTERDIAEVTLVPCGPLAAFPLMSVPLVPGAAQGGTAQGGAGRALGGAATLGDRFAVTVAPSARSVLGKGQGSRARSGVYTLGDPRPTHQPLRWGEAEALAVATLGGDVGRARTGDGATRGWLLESLACGEMVSVSCHGEFDGRDFLRSRLLLADGASLTLADAFGQGVDLSGLPLLVMSACQSAVLDLRGARGEVRSLAAGLLQAGALAVMGSLWSVDDRATFLLMVRFAQEWLPARGEQSPAAALARAQAWLRTVTNRELAAWEAAAGAGRAEAAGTGSVEASGGLVAVRGRGDRYAIGEAEQMVTFLAGRAADLDAAPYAAPVFWAGFQVHGQARVISAGDGTP